jgi:hypothetical protein
MGITVKDSLQDNIHDVVKKAQEVYKVDLSQIKINAESWLKRIPEQYQSEVIGLSDGSGCSLEFIIQWIYFDRFLDGGCTSFIIKNNGKLWVGRNNDYIAPKIWSHVNILLKDNLIPVMLFGIGGDLFSGTGYNKEKIWLHYNWLPVWDEAAAEALPPYVFLRMALESCGSINEIENLLQRIPRDGGMNLFAVDGKDNTYTVFECLCNSYIKRKTSENYVAGANHYCVTPIPPDFDYDFTISRIRQTATEVALNDIINTTFNYKDLIKVLANPDIEQDKGLYGTVYSNLVCPSSDEIYYACDGFPAASESTWKNVSW